MRGHALNSEFAAATCGNALGRVIAAGILLILGSCSVSPPPNDAVYAEPYRTAEQARDVVTQIQSNALGVCIQSHVPPSFPADMDGSALSLESPAFSRLSVHRRVIALPRDIEETTLIEFFTENDGYHVFYEPTFRSLISMVGVSGCYTTAELEFHPCPHAHCGPYSAYVLTRRGEP